MKKIINWSYERASWQWDLLCVLIMIFIFATPKAWFLNQKTLAAETPVEVVQVEDCGCDIGQ